MAVDSWQHRRRIAADRLLLTADSSGYALARLQPDHLHCQVELLRMLAQLVGRALEDREGSEVAGDGVLRADQLQRVGGLARVHRKVIADRQDRQIWLVE